MNKRLLILIFALACGSGTESEIANPLAGLSQAAAKDSTGGTLPPTQPATGDGHVRGTVMGPAAPGSGNDSLQTAPRISGVRIAAFRVTGGTASNPTLSAEVASVTTGADGRFTLPTMPNGEYRVTFTPPSGSVYQGVWVTGAINSRSADYPWWVTLPKR